MLYFPFSETTPEGALPRTRVFPTARTRRNAPADSSFARAAPGTGVRPPYRLTPRRHGNRIDVNDARRRRLPSRFPLLGDPPLRRCRLTARPGQPLRGRLRNNAPVRDARAAFHARCRDAGNGGCRQADADAGADALRPFRGSVNHGRNGRGRPPRVRVFRGNLTVRLLLGLPGKRVRSAGIPGRLPGRKGMDGHGLRPLDVLRGPLPQGVADALAPRVRPDSRSGRARQGRRKAWPSRRAGLRRRSGSGPSGIRKKRLRNRSDF